MKVRVLLAEDSEIATRRIAHIVDASADLHLVQHFGDVQALVDSGALRTADVLLLDMWLPGRNGLTAIRDVAGRIPVVIVSDEEPDSPMAQEAIAQGACAFVSKRELGKPAGEERLRKTIRDAAAGRIATEDHPVVAIVGSTGAPRALEKLIPSITTIHASIVLVQHMPDGRADAFATWLTSLGLSARIASPLDRLRPGRILVAPSGAHMVVIAPHSIRLRPPEKDDFHVPSGDRLLASVASLGPRAIAVVLSGLGDDGSRGVRDVIASGGQCLVQAPDESPAPSMPRAALDVSPRVRAVPLASLGKEVLRATERA